jgi:hypothetical protein
MNEDKSLLEILAIACIISLAAAWAFSAELPVPQFVPIPNFTPIPKFVKTPCCPNGVCPVGVLEIRIPVTAEVKETAKAAAKTLTKRVKQIVGWQPGPCPTCPATPIYGEVEVPMTPDEIKVSGALDKFQANMLTKSEVDNLKATVPGETIRTVMSQRWSVGSCQMACRSGGSLLYNVYDDGTEEVADEQPDSAPEEGVHSGSGGSRLRFRGRR